ncbi:MAG: LPS export ABC transporter periplasmic protein LptC [bacterium]
MFSVKAIDKKLVSAVVAATAVVLMIINHKKPGNSRKSVSRDPMIQSEKKADIRIKKPVFEESEKGRVLWSMRADRGDIYQNRNLALLKGVDIDFFQENGENWHIKGNRGRVDTETMDMTITGQVEADSDRGVRLASPLLNWNNKKRQVNTDRKVRITREGYILNGIGMEFDLDEQELHIKKRVTSRIERFRQPQ